MKGSNFTKVAPEDLKTLRTSLPPRGITISIETMVVREAIENMKIGEAYKIEIKDWDDVVDKLGVSKKKSKVYERVMTQIKWYNDYQSKSRVIGYLNTDKQILAIEKISTETYNGFTNSRNGRFNVVSYRLGKSV